MASQHQRRQPASPPDSPAEPQRFEARWELSRRGVVGPPEPAEGWQALQPFERNLLRNPNPEGVNISEPAPPCLPQAPCKPMDFEDIFRGWQVSVEPVPAEDEEAPSKLTSPCYRWCIKQQRVDLLAEGLWEALLDQYQPNITIMDWYENSTLAPPVYELHIRLLGTTETAVIREFHHVASLKERDGKNKDWHHVSHVFQDYGPGVRYVDFLHKTKEAETPAGLLRTRVTDSSVSVQLRD